MMIDENLEALTPQIMETLLQKAVEQVVAKLDERLGGFANQIRTLTKIKTAAENARRDIGHVLHRIDASAGLSEFGYEPCTIKGVRKDQFVRMCELKKSDPKRSVRSCAKQALDEITGKGGYASIEAIVEYASIHRSRWTTTAKEARNLSMKVGEKGRS